MNKLIICPETVALTTKVTTNSIIFIFLREAYFPTYLGIIILSIFFDEVLKHAPGVIKRFTWRLDSGCLSCDLVG